jgi:uncharacterized protein (DUF58 family)
MDANELIRQVRKIEIKAKSQSGDLFAGNYHSAFKGKGMTFSEVREYQVGDEVRDIDWNVTARFGDPYIKIYEEERELSVMIIADLSASDLFGIEQAHKKDLMARICAVLAFSASQNQDKSGLLLFSDKPEKFIPPKKGKPNVLRIIRELIEFQPEGKGTNIGAAVAYALKMLKKRSIVFIVSDFIDSNYEKELQICASKHELIAIHIYNDREFNLPKMGQVFLSDSESGELFLADTNSKKFRETFKRKALERKERIMNLCVKNKIAYIEISTEDDPIAKLIKHFR